MCSGKFESHYEVVFKYSLRLGSTACTARSPITAPGSTPSWPAAMQPSVPTDRTLVTWPRPPPQPPQQRPPPRRQQQRRPRPSACVESRLPLRGWLEALQWGWVVPFVTCLRIILHKRSYYSGSHLCSLASHLLDSSCAKFCAMNPVFLPPTQNFDHFVFFHISIFILFFLSWNIFIWLHPLRSTVKYP